MWYLAEDKTNTLRYSYCYARSKDGVTWEKPNLGLIEFHGSKQNNIVLTGVVETTVFIDPVRRPRPASRPSRRCTGLIRKRPGSTCIPPRTASIEDVGHEGLAAVARYGEPGFLRLAAEKIRGQHPGLGAPAQVGRVEMDDITKPWPFDRTVKPFYIWGEGKIAVPSHEVPIVFGYDEHDPGPSDHYNAACVQYPWADDAYFLFPSAYRHFPEPPIGKYGNDGLVDIQMATSRDGIQWTRPSRKPYVSLGTPDEVDFAQLYMAVGMLRRGRKNLSVLQRLPGQPRDSGKCAIEDRRHLPSGQQRLDGFVSADAGFEGGEFTTPPLVFSGTAW